MTDVNPNPKPAPVPAERANKMREAMLMEMGKALRVLAMYPAGHPQRTKLLDQAHGALMAQLRPLGDLSLQVMRNGFAIQNQKVHAEQAMILELAQEMHLRQVKSFSLRQDLTAADFSGFLEMLREDPEKFRQGKFVEKWFLGRRIKTIWVNEIDFGRMVAGQAVEAEEEAGPEDEQSDSGMMEEKFRDLVRQIREADRVDILAPLLREAEVWIRAAIDARNHDAAWAMISAVIKSADPRRRTGPMGTAAGSEVKKMLEALLKGDFLKTVLLRLSRPDVPDAIVIKTALITVGPKVIADAIDVLAQREAIGAFKPVMDVILSFGELAAETLENRLPGQNLLAVRKCAYMLGEIRAKRSIDPLRALLSHKDPKVRREAIKALLRYRDLMASRALVGALAAEKDDDLKSLLIQGLGEQKDLAAAPALITIIQKTPLTSYSLPLLMAAIDALGRIGSREALPPLIKVLNSYRLVNRSLGVELRLKAAEALGKLGGESAIRELGRHAGRGNPLADKCREELEKLLAAPGDSARGD